MQKTLRKFLENLQFFAEGAAAGDGSGTSTGVAGNGAADAGQNDALASMGVPAKEIEKYRAYRELHPDPQARQTSAETQSAPEQNPAAETPKPEEAPAKQTLKDALKENQDWNREMQSMMSERVRKTNERLGKATGILGMIAKDYGIETDDPSQIDLDALSEKIENDDTRYTKLADELGTDTETAKRLDKQDRENKQLKAEQKQREQQILLQNHYRTLQQEAEELRKTVPDFNLEEALRDPAFYSETLPGKRLSVKQVYYALHGDEIASRRASEAVGGAKQAMANSMRAARKMPGENGTVQRAASPVQATPYSRMTKEQRTQFERELKSGRRF